jgi:hypothetical protein
MNLENRIENLLQILDQGLSEFDDPDFKIYEILNFSELFSIVKTEDLDNSTFVYKLERVPDGKIFRDNFLKLYDQTGLNLERKKVLKDILDLHQKEFYSGSVTLAYSQIEGVLSDMFVELKAIALNANNTYIKLDVNSSPKLNKKGEEIYLKGLVSKINHLCEINKKAYNGIIIRNIDPNGSDEQLILNSYELNFSEKESTISSTRNKILHGQDISYFSPKRSAQLILWLYSILDNIVRYKKAP